jgi:hypothetical protein
VPGAAFTTLDPAISGVSTTAALMIRPKASELSRAMPREFIDELPFADGLVGSVEFVVSDVYRSNVRQVTC